jgi:hypothetical protein
MKGWGGGEMGSSYFSWRELGLGSGGVWNRRSIELTGANWDLDLSAIADQL